MTLAAFFAAWALSLMAAASPGPAVLMTARVGVTEGLRTGIWLAVGIGIGAVFWATAALFGLSLLFRAAPALLWTLKILGGLYLVWIAIGLWRHADAPMVEGDTTATPRSALSALRLGISTQLANPKPAVFFGAVFLGTVPSGTPLWVIGALLVAVFLNEAGCNILVARLFSLPAARRAYLRLKSRIDRTFGVMLGLLGIKIAAT
ncbi:LysE family transporter [Tabrizicola sp. J26]|uniref:LysE family translocator n=1 Tax=Alitabrizicola rongguiensis TaxID=2909234 RepID=UPI001F1E207F|nr:LysE family transporter [Tabrizicola rongguiensis]MCF1708665.1 LysE family transporter [Tabrizicola rongguiensis]